MTDARDHDSEQQRGRGPGAESGDAPPDAPRPPHPTGSSAADEAAEPELRRALAARYGDQPFVPPTMHEAVLGEARRHFEHIRRRQARRRWWTIGTSAAAAAALAMGIWIADPFSFEAAGPEAIAAQRGDVNGDGVVDVLDMLALASQLERGTEPPPLADVTGDGSVTQRDVEALGSRIVALTPDEEPRS